MPVEPLIVFGDERRLVQVFANLIQNAAKFTGRNGAISVRAERLDGMAVVQIHDNGRGIESGRLSALFSGSALIGETRGERQDGLGIGLRLVKSIVDLHGGAVSAHSDGLGRGSEFIVRLPMMNDVPPNLHSSTEGSGAGYRGNSHQLREDHNGSVTCDRESVVSATR
jgi:signal transduction histidine kinase